MPDVAARRPRLDREAVLEAAESVVARDGWAALTMAAVASRVDVRVPSLYHHVGTLDELRSRLQVRTMRRLSDALRAAAMGRTGVDGLVALGEAQRAFAGEHPELYLGATTEPLDRTAYFAAALPGLGAFLAVIGRPLEDPDAVAAAVACFAAFHGPVSLECAGFFGDDADPGAAFATVLRAVAEEITRRHL